jgi:hypothetical protein
MSISNLIASITWKKDACKTRNGAENLSSLLNCQAAAVKKINTANRIKDILLIAVKLPKL